MCFNDLEELRDGGGSCSEESFPIIILQELQQSFNHIRIAVLKLPVLVVAHHEGRDAIEDDTVVGGFVLQGCLEDVVIRNHLLILVYHLLTGFSHLYLSLLDHLYLLLYLGPLWVALVLILILLH